MDKRWGLTKVLVIFLLTSKATTEHIGHDNQPQTLGTNFFPLKSYVYWISPNPLKIYQKVFIDLAAKYSKHPKRFLSNTRNWGKRSDTLSKELEHSIPPLLDNKIFSKRLWLEENKPEQNSNAPESKKDDVISSRISYIRRSDMNTRLFLYNMFSNHGPLTPGRCSLLDLIHEPLRGYISFCRSDINQVENQKPKQNKMIIKKGKDKRRIGMIQNSPMFIPTDDDEYGILKDHALLKDTMKKYQVCKILQKFPLKWKSSSKPSNWCMKEFMKKLNKEDIPWIKIS